MRKLIPHGRYRVEAVERLPDSERAHFLRCPDCQGWIDCRNLGWVCDHIGPLPHPADDQSK